MNEVLKICSLSEEVLNKYIGEKIVMLNHDSNKREISFDKDIIWDWINLESTYLPSHNRSKGFKIDETFIYEFIYYLKNSFGKFPKEKLEIAFDNEKLLKLLNIYIITYFGPDYNENLRKQIYGYGSLNSIGETINISELKGLNVSRCIEKSSALNTILNLLDFNSGLVLSDANNVGHAYCIIHDNGNYKIVDPNFYGRNREGKGVPYIFGLDLSNQICEFDPKSHDDNSSLKIVYDFPFDKIKIKNK